MAERAQEAGFATQTDRRGRLAAPGFAAPCGAVRNLQLLPRIYTASSAAMSLPHYGVRAS
jgi:hypothetical protein